MNGDHMSEEDGVRLLNHALDPGCTMLDAATIYGAGNNEQRLSRAVMHRRSEFTLASKCALAMRDGERILDARPEAVMAAVDGSLERLGIDHIDLYYMYLPDPQVPIEESIGALVRAKETGKIGAIGLSEMEQSPEAGIPQHCNGRSAPKCSTMKAQRWKQLAEPPHAWIALQPQLRHSRDS